MRKSRGAEGAKDKMLAEQLDKTQDVNFGQMEGFEFRKHRAGFQAVGLFDNGFGCSIIPESDGQRYEVAILSHKNGKHSNVCVTSGLTDDVFRYLSVDSVHDVIAVTRNLKPGTFVYTEPEIICD